MRFPGLSRLMGGGPSASSTDWPARWFLDAVGDLVTATGLRVSTKEALGVPGVAASVQVLADDLAKVPFVLYRRLPGGGKEKAETHPLFPILKSWAAPWLSSFLWRRTLVHNACGFGNGYSRIFRDENARIQRFGIVQPGKMAVRWSEDGEPFFDQEVRPGRTLKGLTYQDVLHVPYRGSCDGAVNGGIIGTSPLKQHKETIALAIAAERFAGMFFANGARPSVVLESDKLIPEQVAKQMREAWDSTYAGVDNKFKVAILELGLKLKEFGGNNQESQLVEVRKHQAELIAQMFRIPPHKIGILDRATFSNIEQQSIDYVTGPVSALAKGFESAVNVACLSGDEREEYFVEFELDGLMRGDIASRYKAYAIGRQWGWLNVDEIREFENKNPLPDDAGKTYLQPMNMVPAGTDPTEEDPADDAVPPKKALVGPDGATPARDYLRRLH